MGETTAIYYSIKKKFDQVNFKDLIDFIEQFMNWAAIHLAKRKELWEAI